MEIEELALLHKALSVPARLRILALIADRPRCVNSITQCMDISQPSVSQHLAVLRAAGLVTGRRHGYMTHYCANAERLRELQKAMEAFPDSHRSGGDRTHEQTATRAATRAQV